MPKIISSTQNKFIKDLVSKLKGKSISASRLCLIEGEKIIKEALKSNVKFMHLFLLYDLENSNLIYNNSDFLINKLINQNPNMSKNIFYVTQKVMKKITSLDSPSNCAAVVEISTKYSDFEKILKTESTILIIDSIQDAGNLGTIIRTCEAFDVKTVFLTKNCVSPYNLKVIRGSMGSIFRVNIFKDLDYDELYKFLKDFNFCVLSTSPNGEDIRDIDINSNKKIAFVVGSEGKGVSENILKKSDNIVAIPMNKKVESLNVAIATGILLYYRFISAKSNLVA